jgi:hypothetical protein
MNAEETKEQNAWLVIDLEAARKHLAQLREKAFKDLPGSVHNNNGHASNAVELLTDDYFRLLDRDNTRALAEELLQTSRLVLELETRLRRLQS